MKFEMDENQKEQLKFDLAEMVVDLLKTNKIELDATRDLSEYILDTLDFLDTQADVLEFLIELHTDWDISSDKFAALFKKYMQNVQIAYGQQQENNTQQVSNDEDKLDSIKNKLAQIAQ